MKNLINYKMPPLKATVVALFWLILSLILLTLFSSCTKEIIYPTPCNGDCETAYQVVYKNQPINPNNNGYYEVEWDELNYFQLKGLLTPLNDELVINGVPLIEVNFDSDYWIVMDTIQFQTPMYSYLGWFNSNTLNDPISVGNMTITLNNLFDLHPPTNIAGYQIPKYFDVDHPAAYTILGTHSKYTYNPTQNFILDNEMVGDTINIFIETLFGSEKVEDQIKVIIL